MAEHNELGREGELVAAQHLMFEGYHILSRNWRSGKLEIDIVAEHRGVLVIVEVKTRRSLAYGDPIEAVDLEKQRHLVRAANLYARLYHIDEEIRFDVITVVGLARPFAVRHIVNAFRSEVHATHN